MAEDLSLNQPLRVFLCHASDDKPIVRKLFKLLISAGCDVWIDEESLLPGQDWQLEIPEAVRKADVVLICLTRESVNKAGYIQKEMNFALDIAEEQPEGTIYLIPVKFEECDIPKRLGKYQCANLFWNGESFDEDGFQKLLKALQWKADKVYAELRRKVESDLDKTLDFREDILKPFFTCVTEGESCYFISAGSMGKTRIIDYMIRKDVQKLYLGEKAAYTLIIRLDMNMIRGFTKLGEWGFYELASSSLICTLKQSKNNELEMLSERLSSEFQDRVLHKPFSGPKASFFFQFSVARVLSLDDSYSICFIMDEFDEAYQKLPTHVFAQLRGIRDMRKSRICYALLLRNLPLRLRPANEQEMLFELLARNEICIGPYSYKDSMSMIRQLEERRNRPIQMESTRKNIYELSGGHPGLILAFFSFLLIMTEDDPRNSDEHWLLEQSNVKVVCQKLLESLGSDERKGLIQYANGNLTEFNPQIYKSLRAKGLLVGIEEQIPHVFSPIFRLYLQQEKFESSE